MDQWNRGGERLRDWQKKNRNRGRERELVVGLLERHILAVIHMDGYKERWVV